jgi:4-hydroxythreonine-4-phosphate dehydrogenase
MVVGDYDSLAAASPRGGAVVRRVGGPDEAIEAFPDVLPVLDLPLLNPVVAGKPSSRYAPAIIRWIETGVGLALSGAVCGLVTAPIAKKPLYEAGFGFPGHTEFLADLTAGASFRGVRGPVMMLAAKDLRTVLVTIHVSLKTALSDLTTDRIVDVGRVTASARGPEPPRRRGRRAGSRGDRHHQPRRGPPARAGHKLQRRSARRQPVPRTGAPTL